MKSLTLYNFFPKQLNLYGDRGNIQVLQKRCGWRNIELLVKEISHLDGMSLNDADILCWGGGGDREQRQISRQLFRLKEEIKASLADGAVGLAICGGYQLLGQYYETLDGDIVEGVQLFDYYTKAEEKRFVGDIVLESKEFGDVVGFENHSGRTYHQGEPLGNVMRGYGNNNEDKTEGYRHMHFIGTYLHGPLLPKNPHISDQMILWAMQRKYGESVLDSLNDTSEEHTRKQAFQSIMHRLKKT